MSEKLKKLIKPMIAAAAVVIVLVIAYFSGSDVSAPDSSAPDIKDPVSASETLTSAKTTSLSKISETTTVSSKITAVDTSASAVSGTAITSTRRTTASKTGSRTVTSPTTTTAAASVPTVTTQAVTSTASSVVTEPEKQHGKCSFSISCKTVFDNKDKIDASILAEQPSDGLIFAPAVVAFNDGESVFDVLKRVCDENDIRIEYSRIAATNSYYIEGINNLYEFDAGNLSGWMYSVNGKYPQLSSSQYTVTDGDVIEFVYSCNIGVDVGDDYYTKAG